ncbi:MAG: leucine-rich repeat domain-containing protein, partial [Ruminococcus sp.]|nr:leucine-rich repeat domain-containing protein [Ruminococcus sp.]
FCDGILYNKDMTVLIKYLMTKKTAEFIIPDSVISIGGSAFSVCTSLTSITIPDSVTSIGECAFYNCRSLTSITIPNSVTSIGKEAFRYCEKLESITIPDSIKSIGKSAFSDGTKIIVCKGNARIPFILNNKSCSYDYEQVLNKIIVSDINDCQQYFSRLSFRYKIAVAMSVISAYPHETYYSDYLKSSVKNVVRFLIDEENIESLYRFLDFGFVTENNIDSFISYAVEHTQNGGSAEPQLVLARYKNDNFGCQGADEIDKFML